MKSGASTHHEATLARAAGALALAASVVIASCAEPRIGTPADEHAARDAAASIQLAHHLEALPGIAHASAIVHSPFVDPLRPDPAAPAATSASIVLALAAGARPEQVENQARSAAAAILGADAAIRIVAAEPPPPPPRLVRVGPFQVAAASRVPLLVTLAAGLVAIAGLAIWIVVLELRRRTS